MRFFQLLLIAALSCVAIQTWAQEIPPPSKDQVAPFEAIRRGDSVIVTGEGPRSPISEAVKEATAPPRDDSNMWYITVWSTTGCQYCEQLKSDFQKAPELLAFVSASEPNKPWAHYNVYNGTDPTQKWRRERYRITAYPTIIVQPPRDGSWGKTTTIVFYQQGYNAKPSDLARAITNSVRLYAYEMAKHGYPKPPRAIEAKEEVKEEEKDAGQATSSQGEKKSALLLRTTYPGGGIPIIRNASMLSLTPLLGQQSPFPNIPPVDPFNPQPNQPNPNQNPTVYPPQVNPNQLQPNNPSLPQVEWNRVAEDFISSSFLTNVLLLGMIGYYLYQKRQAATTATKRATKST